MKTWKVKMHQAEGLRKAGYKQWEIAELLGVSDRMIRNYLKPKPEAQPAVKQSLLDPYHEYITARIDEAPNYNLVVLRKELVAQGYTGGITILRVRAKQVRDEVVKRAVIRFETMPAQQAQGDWKEAVSSRSVPVLSSTISVNSRTGYCSG